MWSFGYSHWRRCDRRLQGVWPVTPPNYRDCDSKEADQYVREGWEAFTHSDIRESQYYRDRSSQDE